MSDLLSKKEKGVLRSIALKACIYPFFYMLIVGAILGAIAGIGFAYLGFVATELELAIGLLVYEIILVILVTYLAVPKSLFKARNVGKLQPMEENIFKKYRLAWLIYYLITYWPIRILLNEYLSYTEYEIPYFLGNSAGTLLTALAIFIANYCTGLRLIKRGDAAIVLPRGNSLL